MGHGVSATLLGVLAYGLKSKVQAMQSKQWLIHGASSAMEIAVGASLIIIGLLGIREAREWGEEIEGGPVQSLSAAAAEVGVKETQKRAVVFNGLLHGFSWDGAPSLAPALAVATWRGNISFLLSYAVGTMAAMTLTTSLIGEATRRAGEVFHRPDIPQKLSLFSSVIAIAVGAIWCGLALR
jgi:sulfite exporter TauE/SafE